MPPMLCTPTGSHTNAGIRYGQGNGRAVYGPDKMSSSANSYSPGLIFLAAFAQRKPPLLAFPALARASICQRAGEGSEGKNSHTLTMTEKVQERQPTENLVKNWNFFTTHAWRALRDPRVRRTIFRPRAAGGQLWPRVRSDRAARARLRPTLPAPALPARRTVSPCGRGPG